MTDSNLTFQVSTRETRRQSLADAEDAVRDG
jgi:hypothetical protein